MPNLTPLLAMLLAREGVPVLIHGVLDDPGRVTTAEILDHMGISPSMQAKSLHAAFANKLPVFMPIAALAPKLHRMLEVRRVLGLRNSTHTLVKIMQPFAQPALRLVSYTHPEYLTMLTSYFSEEAPEHRGDVLLMRGTEGETVANAKRAQAVIWFHQNQASTLIERQEPVDEMPPLPIASDAATTAEWMVQALALSGDASAVAPHAVGRRLRPSYGHRFAAGFVLPPRSLRSSVPRGPYTEASPEIRLDVGGGLLADKPISGGGCGRGDVEWWGCGW
jgi:anthranilate phosphoribosyltransferase